MSAILAASARLLEAEQDRWMLWAPDRAVVTARQAASPQWDDGGNRDGAGSFPRSGGNPDD